MMEFTAEMIAGFLGGEIVGNKEAKVHTVSSIEEGKAGSLTYLTNPKYETFLYSTGASIVLVNRSFEPSQQVSATLIKVDDAAACVLKLLEMYNAAKPRRSGISKLASVAEKAEVGAVCYIGEQRAAGSRVGFGGVVGRGAGGVAHLRIVGVALDRDRTRFEDELHGERLRLSVTRVKQVVHRGRSGGTAEAELTRFHDGRVDQAVLLEQVDGAFEPGDVAFDDVFGLRAATAQHGCGSCEEKCFFHCARILVYFLSSASCFSRLCTSFSSSGSRLKTAAERWYCMPGSAG